MFNISVSSRGDIELKKFLEFHNVYVNKSNRLYFQKFFIECVENYLGMVGVDEKLFRMINFILYFYNEYKNIFEDDMQKALPYFIDEIYEKDGKFFVRTDLLIENFDEFLFDKFLKEFKTYLIYAKEVYDKIIKIKGEILRNRFGLNKNGYKKVSSKEFFFEIKDSNELLIAYIFEKNEELFGVLYGFKFCKIIVKQHGKFNYYLFKSMPKELVLELGWEDKLL